MEGSASLCIAVLFDHLQDPGMSVVLVGGATGLVSDSSQGDPNALASFFTLAGCLVAGALQKELSSNPFPAFAVQMVTVWIQ